MRSTTNKQNILAQTPFLTAVFLGLSVAMLLPVSVFAAGGEESGIAWGNMAMKLFGGLALFLFGMEQMSHGLKAVAGEKMKIILAKLTTNRFMGAATGAFVTAVIQSSSVTTVLVVGFVTAGLMSMAQSIGVIMGANIGTTITAQIVAFKVTKLALLMVAMGFGMLFFSKAEKIKHYGGMLMGLGMIFFGMSIMSDAMSPLRTYEPFLDLMAKMENPLIGILVAAAFTGLIQSSSATTGIVIVMATQGLITLPAGIALAFGANVGTCVTAMLAAIGKPREAVRAAVVHVLFNIAGVLLWLAFIPQLVELVTWVSPQHPELTGTDRLAAEAPRQIANAHTVFNAANTFIFIWFTTYFAKMVERLVPDKPLDEMLITRPKYLDDALLETPSLAFDRVKLELGHMGERTLEMLETSMPVFLSGDRDAMKNVARIDDEVDILHREIIDYVGRISQHELTEHHTEELVELMNAANDIESIGDIVESDALALAEEITGKGLKVSEQTQEVLKELHGAVVQALRLAVEAVAQGDERKAQESIGMKSDIQYLSNQATAHLAGRLSADEPDRLDTYTAEVEIIEKLKRIYYFAKRVARLMVPEVVRERE
ncbi:MAG: Na/Pi cotransporter family protein [Pseudomonadota bacterium]